MSRSSRGSLKATSSARDDRLDLARRSAPEGVDDLLHQHLRRRRAGGDAEPADPPKSSQSISAARCTSIGAGSPRVRPPRPGGASSSCWASRPRSCARKRRRSASPPPGGWWWRSRCRPCAGRRWPETAPSGRRRWPGCRPPKAWSGWCRRAPPRPSAGTLRASSMVSMRCTAPSGNWPMVPSTSGCPAWPIKSTSRPAGMMPLGLDMDLGDQRTGGVEIEQVAPARGLRHRFRHPVGGKDHGRVGIRDFVQFFDEDGALGPERFHHEAVMDDLVAHIDRRAIFGERQLDDLDGTVDAGAKAARRREIDGQGEKASVAA